MRTHGRAGANHRQLRDSDYRALARSFLTSSLLVTPLRKITGLNWSFHFRRMRASMHFSMRAPTFRSFYFRSFRLNLPDSFSPKGSSGLIASVGEDICKRPFLTLVSPRWCSCWPLAITSMAGMIKRLGAERWQALHRLAYVAAIAGVIHFYMQVKSDIRKPVIFAILVGALLGYRLITFLIRKSVVPQAAPGQPAEKTPDGAARCAFRPSSRKLPTRGPSGLVPAMAEASLFAHLPGQYLTLTLDIAGRKVRRNYTIASTPTRPACCEVTIKRDGLASRHMHDTVKEGDTLTVTAPAGEFTFTGARCSAHCPAGRGRGDYAVDVDPALSDDQNWPG